MQELLVPHIVGVWFYVMVGSIFILSGIFEFFAVAEETGKKIFPLPMSIGTLLLGLFFAVGLGYVQPNIAKQSPYKSVTQGVFERAEYGSSGGLISRLYTIVYFSDNSTVVLPGHQDIPFSKGSTIVVQKNKWYWKFETAETKN